MTENEAIARIRYRIDTATDIVGKGVDEKSYEDMEMAIKALEEIQQYRAIGTVEECREARERQKRKRPLDVTDQDLVSLSRFNIKRGDAFKCPCCGYITLIRISQFCPECGQAMRFEESEE